MKIFKKIMAVLTSNNVPWVEPEEKNEFYNNSIPGSQPKSAEAWKPSPWLRAKQKYRKAIMDKVRQNNQSNNSKKTS